MLHSLEAGDQLQRHVAFLVAAHVLEQEGVFDDILVGKVVLDLVDDTLGQLLVRRLERLLRLLGRRAGGGAVTGRAGRRLVAGGGRVGRIAAGGRGRAGETSRVHFRFVVRAAADERRARRKRYRVVRQRDAAVHRRDAGPIFQHFTFGRVRVADVDEFADGWRRDRVRYQFVRSAHGRRIFFRKSKYTTVTIRARKFVPTRGWGGCRTGRF